MTTKDLHFGKFGLPDLKNMDDKKRKTTLVELSGRHHDLKHLAREPSPSPPTPEQVRADNIERVLLSLSSETQSPILRTLFASLDHGVIVLDIDCKVLFVNPQALLEMRPYRAFSVSDNRRLKPSDKNQHTTFKELVTRVATAQCAAVNSYPLSTADQSRQCRIDLAAIDVGDDSAQTGVVISLRPSGPQLFDHQLASENYGLSKAELAVCQTLCTGQSVKHIAALRGTSPETVRYQLKSIFAKTRTNNQHGLVSLLLTQTALPLFRHA